jgi:hypothetical protein
VPAVVAQRIKDHCLFGYPCDVEYVSIGQQVRQKQEEQIANGVVLNNQ